jgi:hypothetical protein
MRVGRIAAGLEAVDPLVGEARRVGYAPLLAEVLLLKGQLQVDATIIGDSSLVLEDAYSTAIVARHDEVAGMAAVFLLYQSGYVRGRFEVAEVWNRSAEALLRRLNSTGPFWGWYLSARAGLRQQQGRLAEAIEDERAAVAAQERASGPASIEVASTIGNLANQLAFSGDFAGALEASRRALGIFSEALGPDHPRSSLFLANNGQFLWRLGRIEEGLADAARALAILERETEPNAFVRSVPLRTLGLCNLELGRPRVAAECLERAMAIRETNGANPLRLAEVRYPLARALYADRATRARALEMAEKALREYQEAGALPVAARDRAQLEVWLAERTRGLPEQKAKPGRRPAKRTGKTTARRAKARGRER